MRWKFSLMGMELFSFEFSWPSKGLYPVPDFIDPDLQELAETFGADSLSEFDDEDEE